MKIDRIEITNYKAFMGTHTIQVKRKNLFIYGENGSGKSSLYFALKDFFQASIEDIDLSELENVFIDDGEKGNTGIKIDFKPDFQGNHSAGKYSFTQTGKDLGDAGDTSIRDANKLKSFLTYKHLLDIHHLKKDDEINLFPLLVNGVLKHFKFVLTQGKELGELYTDLEELIAQPTGREFNITKKKAAVNSALKVFNEAFGELFNDQSPDYILKHSAPILKKFDDQMEIALSFPQVRPNKEYTYFENAIVRVRVTFAGHDVQKPHLFLNEARLSAIAISIYMGMIKRHPQGINHKLLFLDDIFIGLDISNRMPLLEILENDFSDYQIILSTYDKPWFEYAKGFIDQSLWQTLEFYAQTTKSGYEMPLIIDGGNLLQKAKVHYHLCDYKSAAVYVRSYFEKIIQKYCEKNKIKVSFKSKLNSYTTEDFWNEIKGGVDVTVVTDVEKYRSLVLNTFSHYNLEKHEIKNELNSAIQAIEKLKTELS
ncbi:ATP-binding protein [Desulfobacula sp.]|uniref:AAA family ATPase n=1 Tax=Desulfobacula sp. TaxID=2593537 RepID=UPI00262BCAAE|nr:ATP-binding protein [Desulfobacula sp.]